MVHYTTSCVKPGEGFSGHVDAKELVGGSVDNTSPKRERVVRLRNFASFAGKKQKCSPMRAK